MKSGPRAEPMSPRPVSDQGEEENDQNGRQDGRATRLRRTDEDSYDRGFEGRRHSRGGERDDVGRD